MPIATLAEIAAYRKGREKNVLRRSIVLALTSIVFVALVCFCIVTYWSP